MRIRGRVLVSWPAIVSLLIFGMLAGCAETVPKDALRLQESTLDIRSIQTRSFVARSEADILGAAIATLQDMEYNIDFIETELGVLSASKTTDADSLSEQTQLVILDILCAFGGTDCNARLSASDEHRILVTLTVLPSLAKTDQYIARITIQRALIDKANRVKLLERIDDAETYQSVFENLRKAILLQAST